MSSMSTLCVCYCKIPLKKFRPKSGLFWLISFKVGLQWRDFRHDSSRDTVWLHWKAICGAFRDVICDAVTMPRLPGRRYVGAFGACTSTDVHPPFCHLPRIKRKFFSAGSGASCALGIFRWKLPKRQKFLRAPSYFKARIFIFQVHRHSLVIQSQARKI